MPSFAHDLQAEVRKCIGLCASQKLQNLFSSGDVASQCNHNLSQPLARPHSKSRERQPKSYDQTWSSNMSNKYKPLHASGCNIFTYLNATSTANRLYRHLKSHLIILFFHVLLFCGCHVRWWRWIGCQGESFLSRIFEGHKGCCRPQKASRHGGGVGNQWMSDVWRRGDFSDWISKKSQTCRCSPPGINVRWHGNVISEGTLLKEYF